MQSDDIKNMIEEAMPGAQVIVRGDDGVHFEAVVISEDFLGKTLLQQHRLVNALLEERIKSGEIHALALRTYTPDAWQKNQEEKP